MGLEILHSSAEIPQLLVEDSITQLMYLIWCSRKDLQLAFDLSSVDGQRAFCQWYMNSAFREYGLSPSRKEPTGSEGGEPIKINFPYTIMVWMQGVLVKLASILPISFREKGKVAWIYLLTWGLKNGYEVNVNVIKKPVSASTIGLQIGEPGANLIGYAFSELGMGEHVRMSAASMATTDINFGVINFDVGVPSRQKAELRHGTLETTNRYKANIFHINADQMLRVYTTLGEDFFTDRFNISYPFWELALFPKEWTPFLKMMDEVWAPTEFIQEALSNALGKEAVYMPVGVQLPSVKNIDRDHFGIPHDKYVFLMTFDFFSYIHRKNPWAVVRAFILAFPNKNENAGLVIKVMNANTSDEGWKELMEIAACDKRIVIINKVMQTEELLSLKLACDCYVSLHRAEGLGRGPMEAMLLGKPTIVTNYSGSTDYAQKTNSCLVDYSLVPVQEGQYVHWSDQVWADPDIEHAAWHMRRLANDATLSSDLGKEAQQFIANNFSPSRCGEIYKQRLRKLGLI